MLVRSWRFRALQAELAVANHKRELLERHNALLTQQVGWLTTQVNRLEAERSLLIQRAIGVTLPAPVIEAVPGRDVPPGGVRAGRPITDDEPTTAGIDVGVLTLGAAAFEDMGDEEADKQGIPSEIAVSLR